MPVGSIVGGIMGNKAGKQQAKAIQEATDKSIAFQKDMFNQSKQITAPWTEVGGNALNQLGMLMGFGPASSMAGGFNNSMWQPYQDPAKRKTPVRDALMGTTAFTAPGVTIRAEDREGFYPGGQPVAAPTPATAGTAAYSAPTGSQPWQTPEGRAAAQDSAFNAFYTSPGYQFRLGEGIKALDASAAARGRLLSGSQTKAVQQYGEGLAASEYGDYWNRLASLAGAGQTSASGTASQAGATGANVGNTILQGGIGAGNARASGYNALGQGIANGIGAVGNIGAYWLGGGFG